LHAETQSYTLRDGIAKFRGFVTFCTNTKLGCRKKIRITRVGVVK